MKKRDVVIGKKGLSPVIATVLLIAIAVVLALIIFLWAKGFVGEKIMKFDETIENSCKDVSFEVEAIAEVGEKVINIVNRGDVPIYGIVVRKKGIGSVEEIKTLQESDMTTIKSGETASVGLPEGIDAGDEIVAVPIILGKTAGGETTKSYTCDDNYGVKSVVKSG